MYVCVILCMPITESRLEKAGNNVLHPAPPHLANQVGRGSAESCMSKDMRLLFLLFSSCNSKNERARYEAIGILHSELMTLRRRKSTLKMDCEYKCTR